MTLSTLVWLSIVSILRVYTSLLLSYTDLSLLHYSLMTPSPPPFPQVCAVCVGVVSDVCRSLQGGIVVHCDETMRCLLDLLQSPIINRCVCVRVSGRVHYSIFHIPLRYCIACSDIIDLSVIFVRKIDPHYLCPLLVLISAPYLLLCFYSFIIFFLYPTLPYSTLLYSTLLYST